MAEVKKELKLVRGSDDPMSIASLTQTREGHELTVGREEKDKDAATTDEERD
jgi:hypothetical protein